MPRWLNQEADSPAPDDRPEVIAVRLDASEPEGWWYEGCGLYRSVWLHALDRVHFAIHGSWCETPAVSSERAAIRLHANVVNDDDAPRAVAVRGAILDRDGTVVAEVKAPPQSFAPGGHEAILETVLDRPRLWSPDDPYLYRVRLTLVGDGGVTCARELPLGVRWCAFDADRGFSLNGRPLKLNGVSCHQDFAAVGWPCPTGFTRSASNWSRRRAPMPSVAHTTRAVKASADGLPAAKLDLRNTRIEEAPQKEG